MSRHLVVVLIASLIAPPFAAAQSPVDPVAEAAAMRSLMAAVPLGSRIDLRTKTGRRLTGTLMQVNADDIMIKRATRVAEPAVAIAIDDIASVERASQKGGMSVVKAIGIGVGAGAGAMLGLIAFALVVSD